MKCSSRETLISGHRADLGNNPTPPILARAGHVWLLLTHLHYYSSSRCSSPSFKSLSMKRGWGDSHAAYAKNTIHSRLYAIPHEIIIYIAQSLNDEQNISFALSSVKIYKTLTDAEFLPAYISRAAKAALGKKLKRDEFYANRVQRFWTIWVRGRLWCAACDGLHGVRDFPRTWIDVPREERCCFFVRDGGLKPCRHRSWSFGALKALGKAAKGSAHSVSIGLSDCADCAAVTEPCSVTQTSLHLESTGEMSLTARIHLFHAQDYYEVPSEDMREKVRAALIRLDVLICPHLQSSDLHVIDRLLSRGQVFHYWAHTGQPIMCGECDTRVNLGQGDAQPWRSGTFVNLEFKRELGRMKDQEDSVWIRHCQRN